MKLPPDLDPGLREAVLRNPPVSTDLRSVVDFADLRAERDALPSAAVPPGVEVEDRWVSADRRVRIYRPEGLAHPAPALLWMHGGGMVMGTPEGSDRRVSFYAEGAGCVVVSVDYRLAPEHPYPAPIEDCYASLVWLAEHAAELGVDPARIAIGGVSAGGGLAAGTALLARDRGGPSLVFQFLLCPMIDDRGTTPSSLQITDPVTWPRHNNLVGWAAYLGGLSEVPIYAAPARATDLAGLPPAYVDVGGLEIFRDECAEYALRLARAGVSTEFHLWPGAFHGFDGFAPASPLARRARAEQIGALRVAFG